MGALRLPTGEVDLDRTLAPLAMLTRDPTLRLGPGRLQRATWTPDGPGVVVVDWRTRAVAAATAAPAADGLALVRTDGPGAGWLDAQAPALLGLHDDVTGFAEGTPLAPLWREHRGDRVGATGTLWHDLAWFVVQQRVTRGEAAAQWYRLVSALGTPVPGRDGLVAPPSPLAVARLTYEQLHRVGLERRRAEALIAAAACVHRLHERGEHRREVVVAALAAVPGIGPWTLSCLDAVTWGRADTVITGDAGIPSLVAWLLARERRADDARMLALLEPYRPHRYRVVRLAFAAGTRPPRQVGRARPHDIRGR